MHVDFFLYAQYICVYLCAFMTPLHLCIWQMVLSKATYTEFQGT